MGQKGFRDMIKETYLHGAQGYLTVCDITRRDTPTALYEWLAAVAEQTGSIPGLIVVNKFDLVGQQGAFPEAGAEQLAEMYDASVAHTSATAGAGVEQALSTLAVDIVEQAFRDDRARRAGQAFRRRLLALPAKRGTLARTSSSRAEVPGDELRGAEAGSPDARGRRARPAHVEGPGRLHGFHDGPGGAPPPPS